MAKADATEAPATNDQAMNAQATKVNSPLQIEIKIFT